MTVARVRRVRVLQAPACLLAAALLAGCTSPSPAATPAGTAGGTGGSTIVPACPITQTECTSPSPATSPAGGADATGGSTTVSGCPITRAEVEAAVGRAMSAAQIGQPYKNVTQDCSFGFGTFTTATIEVLVFDTEGQGTDFWDSARAESPGATDIPGLADVAFTTASPRATDLFAVKGTIGLHVHLFEHDPLTVDQLAAMARAALARL